MRVLVRTLLLALLLSFSAGPAVADDGSRLLVRFADPAITEASGLVDLGEALVTSNDSGHGAVLQVVDPGTGRTVGRIAYADAATDVEALAPAPEGVWVGDLGDNGRLRSSVRVHRVPIGRGDHRVAAPSVELVYPDGPHDAESLFTDAGGRLHVVTKQLLGAAVYVAGPLDTTRPVRLRRVMAAPALATDAAGVPGTSLVIVRGYGSAAVLDLASRRRLGSFPLPAQPQGEAISIGPGDRVLVTSEGRHAAVLEVRAPHWFEVALAQSRRTTAAAAGVAAGAMLGR